YYDALDVDEKLEDILNKPKEFITSYLKAGDKLPPEVTNIIDNLSIERLQHTISIFFLGLLLYSGIPQPINPDTETTS
ncbi:MAG: hypothetical protein H8E11_05080, partial [Candidatus Cloacimonetes bacterium]|nr:hypothetical protein [Candidatus Cloacimonadota bacterium]